MYGRHRERRSNTQIPAETSSATLEPPLAGCVTPGVHATSLCLSFFICQKGMIMGPPSWVVGQMTQVTSLHIKHTERPVPGTQWSLAQCLLLYADSPRTRPHLHLIPGCPISEALVASQAPGLALPPSPTSFPSALLTPAQSPGANIQAGYSCPEASYGKRQVPSGWDTHTRLTRARPLRPTSALVITQARAGPPLPQCPLPGIPVKFLAISTPLPPGFAQPSPALREPPRTGQRAGFRSP